MTVDSKTQAKKPDKQVAIVVQSEQPTVQEQLELEPMPDLWQRAALDVDSVSPQDAKRLQRTIGNQAVGQLLGRETYTQAPFSLQRMLHSQASQLQKRPSIQRQPLFFHQPSKPQITPAQPTIQRGPFDKALDTSTLETTAANLSRVYIKGMKADEQFKEHVTDLQAVLTASLDSSIEMSTRPLPKGKGQDKNKPQGELNEAAMATGKVFVSSVLGNLPDDYQETAMKGLARAAWKVIVKYEQKVERLTDISAISLIFPDLEVLANSLDTMQAFFTNTKGLALVAFKNRFGKDPGTGYRDMLLNLQVGDHLVELQIHLKEFMEAKHGEGHAMYREFRDISESYLLVMSKLKKYVEDQLQIHTNMAEAYKKQMASLAQMPDSKTVQDQLFDAQVQMVAHREAAQLYQEKLGPLTEREAKDTQRIDELTLAQQTHYDQAGLKALQEMLTQLRQTAVATMKQDFGDQFNMNDYQQVAQKQTDIDKLLQDFHQKHSSVSMGSDDDSNMDDVIVHWQKIAGYQWQTSGAPDLQPIADYGDVDTEQPEMFEEVKAMALEHLQNAQAKAREYIYGQ